MSPATIALAGAAALVGTALMGPFSPRSFGWRNPDARLSWLAHNIMALVLFGGLIVGPRAPLWWAIAIGWALSYATSLVVSTFRAARQQTASRDETARSYGDA